MRTLQRLKAHLKKHSSIRTKKECTLPAVSVIMPVYNRASVVRRAIDSVLGQDFADFELIVVDAPPPTAPPKLSSKWVTRDCA